MDITFGIITAGNADFRLEKIVDSIECMRIPNYEVLIIGKSNLQRNNTRIIEFEELSNGQAWITRKKNLIVHLASYETLVFMHDYFLFSRNWFEELQQHENFDVGMSAIESPNGERYRDWVIWPHNYNLFDIVVLGHKCLIPYDIHWLTDFMYISGGFWISTKHFMQRNLLNENLHAGEGEDVEWSLRIRSHAKIVMLQSTRVVSLKDNPVVYYSPGKIRKSLMRLAKYKIIKKCLSKRLSHRTLLQIRLVAEFAIDVNRKSRKLLETLVENLRHK